VSLQLAESKAKVFVREATGLTRQLSGRDILMYNVLNMGTPWPFLYIFFAGAAYPGVNTPLTVLIGLLPNLLIALLYYYMTVAFPRTGGDYVWVSRLLHPSIGFMESWALVIFFLSFFGPVSGWFLTYGLSTMYVNLAVVTGNQAYLATATALSSQYALLIGSLAVVAVTMIAGAVGLKNTFRFQWATFIIIMIGIAIFLIALATASPAIFKANFNTLSGANYDDLLSAANKAGLVTELTLAGTAIGSFYSFLNYIGYALSVYVGGEVKQSSRSQYIGIVGSTLLFALIVFLVFQAPFSVMGGNFINALAQLSATSNTAYTLPSQPITSYLVIFASPNVFVAILVPLAIIASVIGALETLVVACVRIIFAWSFDGVIPTKFSELGGKRGTPFYALGLVAVVSTIYVLLSIYEANVLTFLAYATSGIFLTIAIVGLAGVVFPYRFKDMFAATPANVQRRLGGVPVVAILGIATFVTGAFVAVIAASPIFTGAALNPYYLLGLLLVFVSGLIIYWISSAWNRSRGVDLSLRFKEIPPE
jgi:amino acid transporter